MGIMTHAKGWIGYCLIAMWQGVDWKKVKVRRTRRDVVGRSERRKWKAQTRKERKIDRERGQRETRFFLGTQTITNVF